MASTPVTEPATRFIGLLVALRADRQMSKKALAGRMGFDPSYVSHIEAGRYPPTGEFAWRADDVLDAHGLLTQAFEDHWRDRHAPGLPVPVPVPPPARPVTELVVLREKATLAFDDQGFYRVSVEREFRNTGARPLIRFPARIEVDVFPGEPNRSASFYGDNPVNVAETGFWATFNGEPTTWATVRDRPSEKEINVLFRPSGVPQPIYPEQSATMSYGYAVHWTKWGDWFGRDIRWPTHSLELSLQFPACLETDLTGYEIAWTRNHPLRHTTTIGDATRPTEHTWSTSAPKLNSLYLFEWNLRLVRTVPALVDLPQRDAGTRRATVALGM